MGAYEAALEKHGATPWSKGGVPLAPLGWPPTGSAVERHRSRAGHSPAARRALGARSSGGRLLSPLMKAGPAAAWQAPRVSRAAAARGASGGAAAGSVMIAARRYTSYELATGLGPLAGPSRSIWLSWVRTTSAGRATKIPWRFWDYGTFL